MPDAKTSDSAETQQASAGSTRIFGSPGRYIQAPGVIDHAADYIGRLQVKRVGILCTPRSQRNEAGRLVAGLQNSGIDTVIASFGGECSLQEIEKQVDFLRGQEKPVEALIALGGGKPIDTAKSVAYRLAVPVIVMPTLASNDSPCAAASVIYTPDGVTESFEVFEQSPSLVIVDTEIIAAAPVRFLVAGMGDAMATWYEARACRNNKGGTTPHGARPTLAGSWLAKLCADTLFEHGVDAVASAEQQRTDKAFEDIVEANTLLSGLGFESGGLAASHAVAQALTLLPDVEHDYLHGEMVAFGVLTQLMLEADTKEAKRVARFYALVGLPVTLVQLGLCARDNGWMDTVADAVMAFPFIGNMPSPVSAAEVRQAFLAADSLGRQVSDALGDAAYRKLHSSAG